MLGFFLSWRRGRVLSVGAVLSGAAVLAEAALPLPFPTNGLVVAFDAAQQPALRKKAGLPGLAPGLPVDRLLNAGTGPAVAVQPAAGARPIFRFDGTEACLRFDGKDDYVALGSGLPPTAEATVFVLAAPAANPGLFPALLSLAQAGQNDYTSGLNLDLGPAATKALTVINLESAGAGGMHNFLRPGQNLAAELPFGGFHVFSACSRIGAKGNEVWLDGIRLGDRARTASQIGWDDLVIGARYYSHSPDQPPFAQGFFQGEIAAVLIYDRALSDAEREQVDQALFARTPALNALKSGSSGHALEVLPSPPVVQMLMPGFAVRELPLKISNINNVRYRHDGKLVALGYDGRIHLLSDSNGDGLEDRDEIFWDQSPLRAPVGMALLPKGDPRGDGVLVASKSRVSLLVDTNRDGRADEEIVVASGWKETFHGVDTVGLALDPKDGSVLYSMGCENFVDAYVRDAAGKSHYQLASERGTIQRVAPDFSRRETVCTGVRFACGLAFNRRGDLFATDQEGATWLPNGNPVDELLQIVPGRHYGFPPRHPKHLPSVIDEPPIMEYGPQHQSTVGMVFDNGVNGGPVFGPAAWEDSALICGESRGKLYRTRLVPTPEGYVAQNQLVACLGLLTIDSCVSPAGALVISCHSGPPDWGTGPAGTGRLFKVDYARPEVPQPVWAWAAAPGEFRIAFDRPLTASDWAGAREKIRIEAGQHVRPGDRYEVIRPGYQVVRDQMAAPRQWVELQSLSLTSDRRTLVLRVAPQPAAVSYAVTLPIPASWMASNGIPQRAEIDLGISLNGVQASLQSTSGVSTLVLPHPSLAVSRELTAGSADHDEFFAQLDRLGSRARLQLRGLIDIGNIFVPATQPGATLDWDIASDAFANRVMAVRQDATPGAAADIPLSNGPGPHLRAFDITGTGPKVAAAGFKFVLDDRIRPVALNHVYLPWATFDLKKAAATAPVARTDVKGNWLHGRRVFFGEGGCATCHTIRGEGAAFGPDLSNLVFRDRDSVLNDILHPSSTINPDHAGSTVTFQDGSMVECLVRSLTPQKIVLRQPLGIETERARSEVAGILPMARSLMPENLGDLLPKEPMEDLLTFLLTNPLEPAPITRLEPVMPPARSRAEVAPLLPSSSAAASAAKPLRILLSAGPKDHGLNEHDYPLWLDRWSRLLSLADSVTVQTCQGFPTAEKLAACDVAVFNSSNPGWNTNTASLLDDFQQRGGGLVLLHWSIEGHEAPAALAERVGLSFSASAFRHGPLDLVFSGSHPITEGIPPLHLVDESYWTLRGDPARIQVLVTSTEDKQPRPQLWTYDRFKGRVFVCIPGHYTWTFDDPFYRIMVLRGIAWAAQCEDISRLLELAPVGARLAP